MPSRWCSSNASPRFPCSVREWASRANVRARGNGTSYSLASASSDCVSASGIWYSAKRATRTRLCPSPHASERSANRSRISPRSKRFPRYRTGTPAASKWGAMRARAACERQRIAWSRYGMPAARRRAISWAIAAPSAAASSAASCTTFPSLSGRSTSQGARAVPSVACSCEASAVKMPTIAGCER